MSHERVSGEATDPNPISIGITRRVKSDQIEAFEAWLVENSGVQLNDGEGYGKGSKRCMRMNIGCSRQMLSKALYSMAEAISNV